MKVNGGRFYEARTTQFQAGLDLPSAGAKTEQCLICHGSGKLADIKAVHAK